MTIAAPLPAAARHQPGPLIEFCRQQPLGAVSFVIIFVMMFAGIFSPLVAPYDPLTIDFASILGAPSWEHWCGTDAFGRDICSRLIYGSRTALVIGFTSSFVGSSFGAVLGIASAYFGGKIDDWIQRFVDILLAFPLIVLALVVVAAFRKFQVGGVDVNLIVAIAIPIVPRVARVVRAAALSVRVMPYVDAARAAGYSHSRIIFRHMAPERGRALPDHAHRLHRAGDPGGSLAVVPRPWRDRADRRLGAHALRQRRRLLSRGAVDDPVPGRRHQPRGVRLQPVRR